MFNPNIQVIECVDFDPAQGPQALATATNLTSAYVSAIGIRRFVGLGIITALADGLTFTVKLMQATSAAGAGAKVLGTPDVVTATGVQTLVAEVDVHESNLDDGGGFTFVAVRIIHTGGVSRDVASILGRVPYDKPA